MLSNISRMSANLIYKQFAIFVVFSSIDKALKANCSNYER